MNLPKRNEINSFVVLNPREQPLLSCNNKN